MPATRVREVKVKSRVEFSKKKSERVRRKYGHDFYALLDRIGEIAHSKRVNKQKYGPEFYKHIRNVSPGEGRQKTRSRKK